MQREFDIIADKLNLAEKKLIVALSGGADSTALCVLCKNANLNFEGVIVDHKYRKNSAEEAKQVKTYLEKKLKIKITILTNKEKIAASNLEKNLRDIRHRLLFNYAAENKISKILTAHHLDDNIETFLMRLERGAGLDGLTGLKTENNFYYKPLKKNFVLIKPLLNFSKDEIKQFLKPQKIKWIEDESNLNTEITRNNIRKTLEGFSDYDLLRKRLSTVIENIERAKDFIEQEKNKSRKLVFIEAKENILNLAKYKNLHEEIRLRILREIVQKFAKNDKDIRLDSIKNLDKNLCTKNFKKAELQGVKFSSKGLLLVSVG